MHSLTQGDNKAIENGNLLQGCLDNGIRSFTPNLMMEKFVQDYKLAKHIYGDAFLRQFSGYDPNYIEKNIKIPEFQRELAGKIKEKLNELKSEGLIDKNNFITDKGIELASLVLYIQEIENLMPTGIFGEKFHNDRYIYGDATDVKKFKKTDRYKDIALRTSIKTSIRRGHQEMMIEDMKSFERQAKGRIYVIYALDSSGSMKGDKLSMCKRAGVALSFKAIEEKDLVGLIVFGKEVKQAVMPTDDFMMLLKEMIKLKATSETNLAVTIKQSIDMFRDPNSTKHLVILTDAMPTFGKDPEAETLEAARLAANNGITISIIGININKKGEELAKNIVETAKGRLYAVKDVKDVDTVILEDYYSI